MVSINLNFKMCNIVKNIGFTVLFLCMSILTIGCISPQNTSTSSLIASENSNTMLTVYIKKANVKYRDNKLEIKTSIKDINKIILFDTNSSTIIKNVSTRYIQNLNNHFNLSFNQLSIVTGNNKSFLIKFTNLIVNGEIVTFYFNSPKKLVTDTSIQNVEISIGPSYKSI